MCLIYTRQSVFKWVFFIFRTAGANHCTDWSAKPRQILTPIGPYLEIFGQKTLKIANFNDFFAPVGAALLTDILEVYRVYVQISSP